jgi:hypothetical protein
MGKKIRMKITKTVSRNGELKMKSKKRGKVTEPWRK